MKVTGIIMFIMTVIVAKHHHYRIHKSISELKSNFFGQVNEDIHILMEKIFNCVNLNETFTKEPNVLLLLTMHHDLSNIANKNFDVLNEIQNITTVNIDNQTQAMINVDTVVGEILNANNFNVYEKINRKKIKYEHGRYDIKKTFSKKGNVSSEFDNSQEFINFVIDFVDKVMSKRPSKDGKQFVSFRRNLKVWEPPSILKIDVNATPTRRLYKGVETKVKKFPFLVSIHIMGEFTCAGCIISRDLIVTAASCLQVAYKNEFFTYNQKSIYVRLGSDYTMRDGEMVPIQKLHFHPLYDPESLRHNVALVKLERRIRFTRQQKRIRRILWDKTPGKLRNNTESVLILGWGATIKCNSDQKFVKDQKLTVDILDVYNFDECKEIYSEDFVSDECFCAGFVNKSGGACNGDIGGPGIVGEVLMGVVSFGAPVCGTRDTPTVFTKLGYYAPWIETIMDPQAENSQLQLQNLFMNRRKKQSGSDYEVLKLNGSSKEKEDDKKIIQSDTKVLRGILKELIQPNNTLVDDLLYGELYDDFKDLFESEETVVDIPRPSLNKSLYLSPFDDSNSNNAYVTILLTTSPTQSLVPVRSHHATHKVGKINAKHGSNILRMNEDRGPKTDETAYEIDSDAKENKDTGNYELGKENDHGMNIEAIKYSTDIGDYPETTTDNSKKYSNVKTTFPVHKQNYSKINTLKTKSNLDKIRLGSDRLKKEPRGISDKSDKKERNVLESSRSYEKKQKYDSGKKRSESDEPSEEIRSKDSSENISSSQDTTENSKHKDSDTDEQNSEESYKSHKKVQEFYNEETGSEIENHFEKLIKSTPKKIPYSQETKENSIKNEASKSSDSNIEEYTTKFRSVESHTNLKKISVERGVIEWDKSK